MLVRQVDRRIGLSTAVAEALHDPRNRERITHELRDLIAQRLYGLCCGYEDLPADTLYDDLYCQRGEADQPEGRRTAEGWSREAGCGNAAHNRIKETQLDLFGTRASSHRFLANWLRVMFAALAYTLMHRLRAIAAAECGPDTLTASGVGGSPSEIRPAADFWCNSSLATRSTRRRHVSSQPFTFVVKHPG